ncbi:cell division protein FtsZ [Seonamhaeicola sp.]|uniref:cell division protein FtsZ n=1 Tax=Seonamhaeicola sp. TaxID=1912245 RepID=UPI00263475A5|nr:cell division protein FtsZ [Seonamhaeicola sp.]
MEDAESTNISFNTPESTLSPIKVIGVGGGGGKAVALMYQYGIAKGVGYYVVNTDVEALQNSPVPNKLQIGKDKTQGLGAGADPNVGEQAARESKQALNNILGTQTKVVIIIAAMGGGTGTGAAPYVAHLAREKKILTIGIITIPFQFEGRRRLEQFEKGKMKLYQILDSLLIINNNRLREVFGNLGFAAGFSRSNEILSIAFHDIIGALCQYDAANLELSRAKKFFGNKGRAIMGMASASGENSGKKAISDALKSPFLDENSIYGAKNVFLHIIYGTQEPGLDEIVEINNAVTKASSEQTEIVMSLTQDEQLEDGIAITLIANGFFDDDLELKTETAKKHLESRADIGQNLVRELVNNKKQNQFFKKEVLLITLMIFFILGYLFVLNGYNNIIAFSSFMVTMGLLSLKLYYVFLQRQKEYDKLIKEVGAGFKKIQHGSEKRENNESLESAIQLSFDLPQTRKFEESDSSEFDYDIFRNIEGISVNDYTELVTFTEFSGDIDAKYVFDYSIKAGTAKVAEEEMGPVNLPISELLKERAEERRLKMKYFNYMFSKSTSDDVEKISPFERQPRKIEETHDEQEEDDILLKGDKSKKEKK